MQWKCVLPLYVRCIEQSSVRLIFSQTRSAVQEVVIVNWHLKYIYFCEIVTSSSGNLCGGVLLAAPCHLKTTKSDSGSHSTLVGITWSGALKRSAIVELELRRDTNNEKSRRSEVSVE